MKNTIYLGATMGGVLRGQLFRERPQELIERLKTVYPLVDQLFVSVDYLAAAESEIKQKGTVRYKAFIQSMEKREIPAQIPQIKKVPQAAEPKKGRDK